MTLDAAKIAKYLEIARDNHDWGDVAEIISELRGTQSYGLDIESANNDDTP